MITDDKEKFLQTHEYLLNEGKLIKIVELTALDKFVHEETAKMEIG